MTNEQRTIRQLIFEDLYVVDEQTIASAIVARANVHATVAGATFRSDLRSPHSSPTPRDSRPRSFRLSTSVALRNHAA